MYEQFYWFVDRDSVDAVLAMSWRKFFASIREKDHPQDAAAIYRNSIDGIIDHKNNRSYDEAAELARKIKALMRHAGQKEEFAAWLEALRLKHKAKRNFMNRIEGM